MSSGRPGLTPFQRARVISLYVDDGKTIIEVANLIGCAKQTARAVLRDNGIAVGKRPRGPRPLSPLALEIFEDLKGHFGGKCTRSDLIAYLGEKPAAIRNALQQLRERGWVVSLNRVYHVAEGHQQRGAS